MAYIKLHRGETEQYDIALVDVALAPLDLDDVEEIWFTVKADYADEDGDAVIAKTLSGGGIAITSAIDGEAQITVDPEDTEDLPSRRLDYPFDVQVKMLTGEIATAIRGRMRISADVTRAIE